LLEEFFSDFRFGEYLGDLGFCTGVFDRDRLLDRDDLEDRELDRLDDRWEFSANWVRES